MKQSYLFPTHLGVINKENFKRLKSKVVFILGRGNNKEEKKNIIKESEAHHDSLLKFSLFP
jgi:hypothetical protein